MRGSRRVLCLFALFALFISMFGSSGPAGAWTTTLIQPSPFRLVPAGLVEVERGSRTLDQIASGFPAPDEAASLMSAWGWQGNAYFNYAGSTVAGTNSLEVSFHLFATAIGATEAMSYFAAGRALMLGFSPVSIGRLGDQALAIGGVRDVGNEVTIYLRIDAVLIRISAVAPYGDPGPDAFATAERILLQAAAGNALTAPRTVEALLPTLWDMPSGFILSAEGSRSEAEVASTFLRPTEAASFLTAWDFKVNVFRYFAIPAGRVAYPSGTTSIEVSLHLFGTSAGAYNALPYYADGRAEAIGLRLVGPFQIGDGAVVLQGVAPSGSGVEVTVYLLLSNVLARISVVSPDGDPTADALAITLIVAGKA